MTVSTQKRQEELLRKMWLRAYPVLKSYHKVTVRIFNLEPQTVIDDKFKDVYGVQDTAREAYQSYIDLEVLLSDDPWTPSGFFTASTLEEEGYLYSEEDILEPDMIIQVVRVIEVDGEEQEELSRKYKLMEPETVGITQVVIRKFKIKALGE